MSIIFHYGYFNAIDFSAYLFIHLHLQCSCTFTFTFSHLADAFVQSDVAYKGENSQVTTNRDLVQTHFFYREINARFFFILFF